jgi:hypothetical protein
MIFSNHDLILAKKIPVKWRKAVETDILKVLVSSIVILMGALSSLKGR